MRWSLVRRMHWLCLIRQSSPGHLLHKASVVTLGKNLDCKGIAYLFERSGGSGENYRKLIDTDAKPVNQADAYALQCLQAKGV